MATQAERRDATREAILAAAGKLFQKHGFEETAVEQITAAANVAKGTFYQHFPSKGEILLALIRHEEATLTAEVERRLGEDGAPLKVGRWLIGAIARSCEEHRKMVSQSMLMAMTKPARKGEPSTRTSFASVFEEAQRRGDVRGDIDAYDLALTLVAGMVPAMMQWAQSGKKGELAGSLEKAWQIFLEGAGK
jgi:AcrR family transcriptional regulator